MNPYLLPAVVLLTFGLFSGLAGLIFQSHGIGLILTRLFLLLAGALGALLVYWLWSSKRSSNIAAPSLQEISELDSMIQLAVQQLQSAQRNGSSSLSKLPLLYILGAPNSGKTTTISKSGMAPELLAGHVYQDGAVVPTQRLNIWYASETVFVDAGDPLTLKDSLWSVLVRRTSPGTLSSLLHTHRPLRAAVVCISSESFLGPDASKAVATLGREINLSLRQIARQLGVDLPVHVILTKLDRIPGFTEYVQHLTQQEVTEKLSISFPSDSFPINVFGERASTLISESLDQLIFSVGEFRLELLSRDGNTSNAPAIYQFPRELQKLRGNLITYLLELTRPTHLYANPSLRSFSCIGVRARILDQAVLAPAQTHRSTLINSDATGIFSQHQIHALHSSTRSGTIQRIAQWTFLSQLFPQVFLAKEEQLIPARANRRVVLFRSVAYAVASVLLASWGVGLTISYYKNASLQRNIRDAAASLSPIGPPVDFASESQLVSLERLRVAISQLEQFEQNGAPWSYRWGLYRGHDLIGPSRALYFERFRWLLLSATQNRIRRTLNSLPSSAPAEADYLSTYNPLRAYLITTSFPQYSSGEFLEPVLTSAWLSGSQPQSDNQERLARQQFHFYGDRLRNAPIYDIASALPTVLHARAYLNSFGGLDRVYQNMLSAANRSSNSIDFNRMFPGSAATVVETHVVPGAFSRTGYAFMEKAFQNPERYFTGEPWVLGDQQALSTQSASLSQKLAERYAAEYSSQWQTFLRSATVVRFRTMSDAVEKLGSLSSPNSALLALIFTASHNTSVASPVVAHQFQPTQSLVPPNLGNRLIAPSNTTYINGLIGLQGSLSQLVQVTDPMSTPIAAQNVIAASTNAHSAVSQTAQAFDPDPSGHVEQMVIKLLQEPIISVEESVRGAAPAQVNKSGQQFCATVSSVLTKYPFRRSATTEAAPTEVASILQPGSGALWQFYEANLKTLIIQQGTQWVAAPTATVKPTPQFLQFFNRLAMLSGALFPHGTSAPTLQFNAHILRSPGIQSVTFALDGQKLSGADVTKTFSSTVQSSQEAQLLATYGGNNLPLQFTGNWALFHLVDHGHIEQTSSPLRLSYPLEISGTPIVVDSIPLTERIELSGFGADALSPGARSELQCVSQVAR